MCLVLYFNIRKSTHGNKTLHVTHTTLQHFTYDLSEGNDIHTRTSIYIEKGTPLVPSHGLNMLYFNNQITIEGVNTN